MFRFRPENTKIESIESKKDKENQLVALVAKEKSVLEKSENNKRVADLYRTVSAWVKNIFTMDIANIERAAKKAGVDPKKILDKVDHYRMIKEGE